MNNTWFFYCMDNKFQKRLCNTTSEVREEVEVDTRQYMYVGYRRVRCTQKLKEFDLTVQTNT